MPSTRHLFLAAVAGALGTYFLDPQQRRRRSALVRDRAAHAVQAGSDLASAGMRDLTNRMQGAAAGLQHIADTRPPRDEVPTHRIRPRLGPWLAHPRTIQV